MDQLPDFPPDPFASIDCVALSLCEALRDGFGSHDEVSHACRPERLLRNHSLWNKSSGGWLVEFDCSIRFSDGSGYLPRRLEDRVDGLKRDAFLAWLDTEPFDGAADEAAYLRRGPSQSLCEYAAQYLGKSKAGVDHDMWRSAWNALDDLPADLLEKYWEHEQEWLDGSYRYGCEIAYFLPDDAGSPLHVPVVQIDLTFNDDEYRRQGDTIGKILIMPEAFREGVIPLLERRIVAIFQDQ